MTMGLWIGMAIVLSQECGSGWGGWSMWNPIAYYRSLSDLSYSPWAMLTGSVHEVKRESLLALGTVAATGVAYSVGGVPAALKAVKWAAAFGAFHGGRTQAAGGFLCDHAGGEPEWVESARPSRFGMRGGKGSQREVLLSMARALPSTLMTPPRRVRGAAAAVDSEYKEPGATRAVVAVD